MRDLEAAADSIRHAYDEGKGTTMTPVRSQRRRAERLWLLTRLLVTVFVMAAVACQSKLDELTIELIEQEDSGQMGTATLTARADQTEVVIDVSAGPPADDPQPIHIHFGTCGPNLGSVHYPLNDVSAGKSTTLIDDSLASLADGNHNINLHKSHPDIRIYTSCGNIPRR